CTDLAGVGGRARDRAHERKAATGKDYTDADYLLESVCQPGAYVVQGFGNIMPTQCKVLSPGQIIAVAAFLQDQGGEASVKLAPKADAEAELSRFGCTSGAGAAAPVVAAEPVGTPDKVVQTFGCVGCHSFDAPTRIIGPSLKDVGK